MCYLMMSLSSDDFLRHQQVLSTLVINLQVVNLHRAWLKCQLVPVQTGMLWLI